MKNRSYRSLWVQAVVMITIQVMALLLFFGVFQAQPVIVDPVEIKTFSLSTR